MSIATTYTYEIDPKQGIDKSGNRFGWVGVNDGNGNARGGWFFTWCDTMAATIASIEQDEISPPPCDADMMEAERLVRQQVLLRRT